MGNQACVIHTGSNSDIQKLIGIFRKYTIREHKDKICTCYERITLNKEMTATVDEVYGTVGSNQTFTKGKQFLFVEGDRSGMNDVSRLFDTENINYTTDELILINKVQIIYAEYIDCERIYHEDGFADVEEIN